MIINGFCKKCEYGFTGRGKVDEVCAICLNSQLDLAKNQRFISLRNAFDTIKCFAEPSLSPDQFEQLDALELYLLSMYSIPAENC